MNERYFITVTEALALEAMEDAADREEAIEAEREAEWARLAAIEEAEAEMLRQDEEYLAKLWEAATPEAWVEYYDLYKDVYGIRPRWAMSHFHVE